MCAASARDFSLAGELYQQHEKKIRSYIRRRCEGGRVPEYHVDDIAHDVFERVSEYGIPAEVGNVSAYLMQIAQNCIAELAERRFIRNEHITLEDDEQHAVFVANADIEPDYVLEHEQSRERIRKIFLNTIKGRHRDVLLLHLDGVTYKQIAATLGISYRMVLRDLTNAYSKLRHALADEVDYLPLTVHATKSNNNIENPMPAEFPRMNLRLRTRALQSRYRVSIAVLNKWREMLRDRRDKPQTINHRQEGVVSNVLTIERSKAQKSIAVEKAIPIPKSHRDKDERFPWGEMEVGDSYWIGLADEPDISPGKDAMPRLHNRQAARCQKAGKDFKRSFKARIQRKDPMNADSENGVRVWRTK